MDCPKPTVPTRRRCGHCKRLVPEYQKLGEAITKDPKLASRVVIAKVGARLRAVGLRRTACCPLAPASQLQHSTVSHLAPSGDLTCAD